MVANNWRTVRLGEICRFKYGEMPKKADLADGGYPVFSGYRQVGFSQHYHYRDPEIIVVARGVGGTGDIKMTPPFCFLTNLSIAILLESPDIFKPFLYYRLLSTTLWELRTGSAQAQITIERLKDYEIRLPPLSVQRRIAGILSNYDELIENSQRRIQILEAMARALYREWFVHFRFPGHENHPRVPSPLGEIPEGWEVCRIDEALNFASGKTIKKADRECGDTLVYGANGVIGGTANPPMADQCIIMGKIGSCGALHRSHVPCWVTNNAFLIRPAMIQSIELAWQVLLDIDFRQYIGGAANPYMPINSFGQHEVLLPPTTVQEQFEAKTDSLRELIQVLSDRIQSLRGTRDELLPRLLSGRLELEVA